MAKQKRQNKKKKDASSSDARAFVSGRCDTSYLQLIRDGLNAANLELFRASCFGHFLQLKSLQFQGQLMFILYRNIDKNSLERRKLGFRFNNKVVELGPPEYLAISGLRFSDWSAPPTRSDFHHDVFGGDQVLYLDDIVKKFDHHATSSGGASENCLKLALLLVLYGLLLPRHKTHKRIEIEYIHLVDDLAKFNLYPWGLVSYQFLVTVSHNARLIVDDKLASNQSPAFDACGCTIVLQVFLYEVYKKLGEMCATRVESAESLHPRMLRWSTESFYKLDVLMEYFKPEFENEIRPIVFDEFEMRLIEHIGFDTAVGSPIAIDKLLHHVHLLDPEPKWKKRKAGDGASTSAPKKQRTAGDGASTSAPKKHRKAHDGASTSTPKKKQTEVGCEQPATEKRRRSSRLHKDEDAAPVHGQCCCESMKDIMLAQLSCLKLIQGSLVRLESKVVDGETMAKQNEELRAAFDEAFERVQKKIGKSVLLDSDNDADGVDDEGDRLEDEDAEVEDAIEHAGQQNEQEEGVMANKKLEKSAELDEIVEVDLGVKVSADTEVVTEVEVEPAGEFEAGDPEVEAGDVIADPDVEARDMLKAAAGVEKDAKGSSSSVVEPNSELAAVAELDASAQVNRIFDVEVAVNPEGIVESVLKNLGDLGELENDPLITAVEASKNSENIVQIVPSDAPVLGLETEVEVVNKGGEGGQGSGQKGANLTASEPEPEKMPLPFTRLLPVKKEKKEPSALTSPLKITRSVSREQGKLSPSEATLTAPSRKRRGKQMPPLPDLLDTSAPYPLRCASNQLIEEFEQWKLENQGRAGGDEVKIVGDGDRPAHWFKEMYSRRGWCHGDQLDAYMNLMIWHSTKGASSVFPMIAVIEQFCWQSLCEADIRQCLDKKVRPYVEGSRPWFSGTPWWQASAVVGVGNIDNQHWVAYQLDFEGQTVRVFDSMRGAYPVERQFENVLKNLPIVCDMCEVFKHKNIPPPYKAKWSLDLVPNCPQQVNNHDCGIFALKFVQCIISSTDISELAGLDMGRYRKSICAELYMAGRRK